MQMAAPKITVSDFNKVILTTQFSLTLSEDQQVLMDGYFDDTNQTTWQTVFALSLNKHETREKESLREKYDTPEAVFITSVLTRVVTFT